MRYFSGYAIFLEISDMRYFSGYVIFLEISDYVIFLRWVGWHRWTFFLEIQDTKGPLVPQWESSYPWVAFVSKLSIIQDNFLSVRLVDKKLTPALSFYCTFYNKGRIAQNHNVRNIEALHI